MLQGLIGQESPWPPPPNLPEEEEQNLATGYSFDLPDPPTDMEQVSQISSKNDCFGILGEDTEGAGFPSDNTDTEAGR